MTPRLALLLLPLALAACASKHPPLAQPSGAIRPLNMGRWTPSAADLAGVREPAPAHSAAAAAAADGGRE